MKFSEKGGMLVPMLFLTTAFFWLGILVVSMGQASMAAQRAQTLADISVLSSLRLRVEALEIVAARWQEFGALFGAAASDGTVRLPGALWGAVVLKADELKRALPGYQGRTTAVIKVAVESNGGLRDQIQIVDDAGARIGLTAEPAVLKDEEGQVAHKPSLWLRRGWQDKNSDTTITHRAELEVPMLGKYKGWKVAREAVGRVAWDVDPNDAQIKSFGNGGYPRDWGEAVQQGRLEPNRWAVYRAELVSHNDE